MVVLGRHKVFKGLQKRLAAKDRNNKIMDTMNIKSRIVVMVVAPGIMEGDAVSEGNAEGFDYILILFV